MLCASVYGRKEASSPGFYPYYIVFFSKML